MPLAIDIEVIDFSKRRLGQNVVQSPDRDVSVRIQNHFFDQTGMQGTGLPGDVTDRRVDIHITGPQQIEERDLVRVHINAHPSPAFLVQEKSIGAVDRVKSPRVDVNTVLNVEEFVEPSSQPNILPKLAEGEPKISNLLARKLRRIP